jgi:hypothetical protein
MQILTMSAKKVLRLIAALAVGLSGQSAGAVLANSPASVTGRLAAAQGEHELDSIVAELDGERERTATKLLAVLRSSDRDRVKARACYLLGVLGDASSVDTLIDNIGVAHSSWDMELRIPLMGPFPCAESAARFGVPAQERVLSLLATTEDVCKRDLGLMVLEWLMTMPHGGGAERDAEVRKVLIAAGAKAESSASSKLQRALEGVAQRSWLSPRCKATAEDSEDRPPAVQIHRFDSKPDVSAVRIESLEMLPILLESAKSSAELDAIVKAADERRHNLLSLLDALLLSTSRAPVKSRVCYLLGRFHTDRVDPLIKSIDVGAGGTKEGYPCENALIRAGRVYTDIVVTSVSREENPERRAHLVNVITSLYGARRAVLILEAAMKNEKGDAARRLAEALKVARAQ